MFNILGIGGKTNESLSKAVIAAKESAKWDVRKKLWHEFQKGNPCVAVATKNTECKGRMVLIELRLDTETVYAYAIQDGAGEKPKLACFIDETAKERSFPSTETKQIPGAKLLAAAEAANLRSILINPGEQVSGEITLWENEVLQKNLTQNAALLELAGQRFKQNVSEAEAILRRILTLADQGVPLEARLNAQTLTQLADCVWHRGQSEEAEKLYGRARTIWDKNGGFGTEPALRTLLGLGCANIQNGRVDLGIETLSLFLDRSVSIKDMDPRSVSLAMCTCAMTYKNAEKIDAQLQFLEKYCNQFSQLYGETHQEFAAPLSHLVNCYVVTQDWSSVEKHGIKLLSLRADRGDDAPGLLIQALGFLALSYFAQQRAEEGESFLATIRAIIGKGLDLGEHVPLVDELATHFLNLRLGGKIAEELFFWIMKAPNLRERYPVIYINTQRSLSLCLSNTERAAYAQQLFETYIAEAQALLPRNHFLVANREASFDELVNSAAAAPPPVRRMPQGDTEEAFRAAKKTVDMALKGEVSAAAIYCEGVIRRFPASPSLICAKGVLASKAGDLENAAANFRQSLELDGSYTYPLFGLGDVLREMGNLPESYEHLKRYTEKEPGDAEAWTSLAIVLNSLGRQEEALLAFEKAVHLIRRCTPALKLRLFTQRGNCLVALGRFDLAIASFERALGLDPNDAATLSAKGNCFLNIGESDKALSCFERVVQIRSNDINSLVNLGVCQTRANRAQEALRTFDTALRQDTQNSYAWVSKGEALASLKRFDEAMRCYESAMVTAPEDPMAWFARAKTEILIGKIMDGAQSFERYLRYAPQTDAKRGIAEQVRNQIHRNDNLADLPKFLESYEMIELWSSKAMSLLKEREYKLALECIDKAIEIYPRQSLLWDMKSNCLMGLDQDDEALKCVDKFIEIEPDQAFMWCRRGECLAKLGRNEEAIDNLERAIRIDPQYPAPWAQKGVCFSNLARYEDAVQSYDRALGLDPSLSASFHGKGNALVGLSRCLDAITAFDRAILLAPENDTYKADKGRAMVSGRQFREAVSWLRSSVGEVPQNLNVWATTALALLEQKQYAEAGECFEVCVKLDPKSAQAWSGLAVAESRIGNKQRAIDVLQNGLKSVDPPSQAVLQQILRNMVEA